MTAHVPVDGISQGIRLERALIILFTAILIFVMPWTEYFCELDRFLRGGQDCEFGLLALLTIFSLVLVLLQQRRQVVALLHCCSEMAIARLCEGALPRASGDRKQFDRVLRCRAPSSAAHFADITCQFRSDLSPPAKHGGWLVPSPSRPATANQSHCDFAFGEIMQKVRNLSRMGQYPCRFCTLPFHQKSPKNALCTALAVMRSMQPILEARPSFANSPTSRRRVGKESPRCHRPSTGRSMSPSSEAIQLVRYREPELLLPEIERRGCAYRSRYERLPGSPGHLEKVQEA